MVLGTPLLWFLFARYTATADGPGGRAPGPQGHRHRHRHRRKTVPVSSDRECHTWFWEERERRTHTEMCVCMYVEEGMQGATRVVRAHTTHSRQVLPQYDTWIWSCGMCTSPGDPDTPAHGHRIRHSGGAVGCGRGLPPGASHESSSLSRLLRQEALAPQMCVGRVNCDARGMQRGPHPAGEKEGISRTFFSLFPWTLNCHADRLPNVSLVGSVTAVVQPTQVALGCAQLPTARYSALITAVGHTGNITT